MLSISYENIVFSGGSIKGLAFIGILKYLEKNDLITSLKCITGASSGSIIAFLFCLGYNSDEILHLCVQLAHEYTHKEVDMNLIFNLYESLGFDDGLTIENFLRHCLYQKYETKTITFYTLYHKNQMEFNICASNLTKKTDVFFNHITYPHIDIISAIRASITIPFIFTPIIIENDLYVDAAIYNNFPINYIQEKDLKKTLGVSILNKKYNPPPPYNILNYTNLLFKSMIEKINDKEHYTTKTNIIKIDMSDEDMIDFDLHNMRLKIDTNKFKEYIEKGYNSISEFIDKIQEKKRKEIRETPLPLFPKKTILENEILHYIFR